MFGTEISSLRLRNIIQYKDAVWGAPKWGGGYPAAALPKLPPQKPKFKKHIFCRHNDIKIVK